MSFVSAGPQVAVLLAACPSVRFAVRLRNKAAKVLAGASCTGTFFTLRRGPPWQRSHSRRAERMMEKGAVTPSARRGIDHEEDAERCRLRRTYCTGIERGVRNVSLVNTGKRQRAGGNLSMALPAPHADGSS